MGRVGGRHWNCSVRAFQAEVGCPDCTAASLFYLGASGAASAWAHPRRVIRLGWGEAGWCAA